MNTQTDNRSSVGFSVFTWLSWAALGILFSITVALVLDASKFGRIDWQLTIGWVQKALMTGTLFFIGIHVELHRLSSDLHSVITIKANDVSMPGESQGLPGQRSL